MKGYNQIYSELIRTIEKNFYNRDFLNSEKWKRLKSDYHDLLAELPSERALLAALKRLVEFELGASHCRLVTKEQSELEDQTMMDHQSTLESIFWCEKSVLYYKLNSFCLPFFKESDYLNTMSKNLNGASVVVLDLRFNNGGSTSATGTALGVFIGADKDYLFTSRDCTLKNPILTYPFDENKNKQHRADVEFTFQNNCTLWKTPKEAKMLLSEEKKLVILIDQHAYSCGELFIQSLRENSAAVLIGQPTSGCVVAARDDFVIGDRFSLCLPYCQMYSSMRKTIEGNPIQPDILYEFGKAQQEVLDYDDVKIILEAIK